MKSYYENNGIVLYQGHVIDVLASMNAESVDCMVTSPPYWGLRDYNLPTIEWPAVSYTPMTGLAQVQVPRWSGCLGLESDPSIFVGHLVLIWRELWRVMKPEATCWLNLGDSYAQGGGKKYNINESRIDAKRATDKDYPTQAFAGYKGWQRATGTAVGGLKPKDLCGIPWRVAFALQADGWYLRSDIIWHKLNPMPESVRDRCTHSHEYLFLLAKQPHYYFDNYAIQEPNADPVREHYNHGAKMDASRNDTNRMDFGKGINGRNRRDVWTIATFPYKGAHFATFPPALVEPCILAGTSEKGICPKCGTPWKRVVSKGLTVHDGNTDSLYPEGTTANRLALLRQTARKRGKEYVNTTTTTGWTPGCECGLDAALGVVLDPFAGSGTVLEVALKLGRHAIGIELSETYCKEHIVPRLAKYLC